MGYQLILLFIPFLSHSCFFSRKTKVTDELFMLTVILRWPQKCLSGATGNICVPQKSHFVPSRARKAAESNTNPPCNRRNKTSKFLVVSPGPLLLLSVTCSEKETEILVAGNTHRGNFSSHNGAGKCGFCCIFRAVIRRSAKKICSIQKLSGFSCHSFLSDLILRQVLHSRCNDGWKPCTRTDKEEAQKTQCHLWFSQSVTFIVLCPTPHHPSVSPITG